MALLLDTTVLVDYLRGDRWTVERLSAETVAPLVSAVSVEELEFGVRSHEREATDDLLEAVTVVGVDELVARQSGSWRREYASKGVTLSPEDTLIAASAHLEAATLATANVRHFPMPELRVQRWPAEE